jgi:hypothetical protein
LLSFGHNLSRADRAVFERLAATARAELARHPQATAWLAEGRAMDLPEAIRYALQLPGPANSEP